MLAGSEEPGGAYSRAPSGAPSEAPQNSKNTRGLKGLKAPPWPETILPKIDRVRAEEGHGLYRAMCQDCHLPPVQSQEFSQEENWTKPNRFNKSFVKLPMIEIAKIGTDPAQAADMQARTLVLPQALGLSTSSFGPALGQLVEKSVAHWYDTQVPPIPQDLRDKMNGFRDNRIRAELAYRARPLDGIWSTAPFLHNGSVPTLYALLSPVAERPKLFQLGQRDFDPVRVGYSDTPIAGGSRLDTSIRGNWNIGHEFADRPGEPGVIGRALTPQERMDLIEFLKTL
jgi:hypothetical protein